jgi:hypothetical protein
MTRKWYTDVLKCCKNHRFHDPLKHKLNTVCRKLLWLFSLETLKEWKSWGSHSSDYEGWSSHGSSLKNETVCSYETFVNLYQSTGYHTAGDSNLQSKTYFQHITGNQMSPLQTALNGHMVARSKRLSTLTKHDGVQFASQVRRRLFDKSISWDKKNVTY